MNQYKETGNMIPIKKEDMDNMEIFIKKKLYEYDNNKNKFESIQISLGFFSRIVVYLFIQNFFCKFIRSYRTFME